MAWPGPGFSGICAKNSHSEFFHSTFLDWKNLEKAKLLKLYFFVYLYKMDPKGKNEPGPGDL